MKILLVDNDERNRQFLKGILSPHGHEIVEVSDGPSALSFLENQQADLVLCAAVMPEMSGFEVTRSIKARSSAPVLLLTGLREEEDIVQGLASGVDEILSRPFIADELLLKIRNVSRWSEGRISSDATNTPHTGDLQNILKDYDALNHEMVFRLLAAAEYKDDETGKHIIRVGKYSRIIAETMGFKGEYLDLIERAAPMHDLGKIGIPDRMLLKSGKLTPKEFEIMKTHTLIGASILEGSRFPLITMAYDVALTHHEKWDGTGYDGIKGEKIPLSGRIVALADVLDALTSPRPYKPPFSWEKSVIIIREGRGKHFDPRVVDAFMKSLIETRTVYTRFGDPEIHNYNLDIDTIERMR